jgi:hypothetical protein
MTPLRATVLVHALNAFRDRRHARSPPALLARRRLIIQLTDNYLVSDRCAGSRSGEVELAPRGAIPNDRRSNRVGTIAGRVWG